MRVRDIVAALVLLSVAVFLVVRFQDQDSDDEKKGSGNRVSGKGSHFSGGNTGGGSDRSSKVALSGRKLRERAETVTTDSGLTYEVLKEVEGANPGPTSMVKVHYVATLEDGTVFDSSRDSGEPATFLLNEVIKGWAEGLQLMKLGGVSCFTIPPDLAFGENVFDSGLPENATLIVEVELISIEKP